eukprot:6179822-Pleurochrysis_carterae.AAC.1
MLRGSVLSPRSRLSTEHAYSLAKSNAAVRFLHLPDHSRPTARAVHVQWPKVAAPVLSSVTLVVVM